MDKNGGRGRDCRQRKRECGGWAAGETESWVASRERGHWWVRAWGKCWKAGWIETIQALCEPRCQRPWRLAQPHSPSVLLCPANVAHGGPPGSALQQVRGWAH